MLSLRYLPSIMRLNCNFLIAAQPCLLSFRIIFLYPIQICPFPPGHIPQHYVLFCHVLSCPVLHCHTIPYYIISCTILYFLIPLSDEYHTQAVASIYDDFQEHISIPKLAKALYELANTHPYQAEELTPRIQNSDQLQGGKGDDEEVRI